jgi:phenylalanyl-tRNA synthetase beta chain
MCIAGVFGGQKSGVGEQTTRVFIESAYFHPDWVRRTAMRHGLKTDASFRFERGTDPNMTVLAAQWAALLMVQVAGGRIASDLTDVYPNPIAPARIAVKYRHVDRLIGKAIDRGTIKGILEGLEMTIVEESEQGMLLDVPPYRVDVRREADVIEDILRIYGFNQVEIDEQLSADSLANFPARDKDKTRFEVSLLLAANGANEIFSNSLTNSAYWQDLPDFKAEENVEVLNKLSQDLDVMRQTMVFSGLEAIAYNLNRRQKDLKLFEFGRTYRKSGGGYEEREVLAIFATGGQHEESWMSAQRPTDFHALARMVQLVLQRMGVGVYDTADVDMALFQYGVQYVFRNRVVARLGQLKAQVAKKTGVKQAVFYAELDWQALLDKAQQTIVYQEIPKFPEVRRDLAMLLDKRVKFDDIKRLAQQTERKLLRQVNVFDVYEGKNIEEGKKSYALSFVLQDETQTLTDKVIDKTMERLMQRFEQELGAVIRKS